MSDMGLSYGRDMFMDVDLGVSVGNYGMGIYLSIYFELDNESLTKIHRGVYKLVVTAPCSYISGTTRVTLSNPHPEILLCVK